MKIFLSTYSYTHLVYKPWGKPINKITMWDYLKFTDWEFSYTWIDESAAYEL